MTPNQYTFRYRVRNWSDYNRALIARGRLTFWFDEDAVAAWRNADPPKGPGAPKVYSDTAIQCALILKSVFQLSLRSTQGFVSSLLELLRLDLPVPDYSTLSRRQSSLATFLTVSPSSRPRHAAPAMCLRREIASHSAWDSTSPEGHCSSCCTKAHRRIGPSWRPAATEPNGSGAKRRAFGYRHGECHELSLYWYGS